MKLLSKVSQKVAKVKHATKLFSRDIRSRVKNQFSKRGQAPISQEVFNHKKFAQLGYESLDKPGVFEQKLRGTGYSLDPSLSNEETKVFHNPHTKEVTVAYRGTALNKPSRWKDVRSDLAILTGTERHDKRFKEANRHFKGVTDKYGDYNISTTGHSLGGQIAKHVNDSHKGKVKKNVVFSRGTGLFEPFRKKQENTVDVSNQHDLISLGARLQGGNQVVETKHKGLLESHNLGALFH